MSEFNQKVMIRKPPQDFNTLLEAFVFCASVLMISKKPMYVLLEERGKSPPIHRYNP